MKLTFTRQDDLPIDFWIDREYLLTNGAGGFACGTLADCPTRKYHGLLALPDATTSHTNLLLSKIELSLLSGSQQYDLSTNLFPDTVFPEGYRAIQSVEIEQYPVTVFTVNNGSGEIVLRKSILMPRGGNAVLVRYELLSAAKPITLKLMPFLAYRDIHGLARQNADLRPRTYFEPNGFKVDPYPRLPPLFIQTSRASMFYPSPDWWKNFEYREERSRGYDFSEDLFSPGVFEVKLKKGESVTVRAALAAVQPHAIEPVWDAELDRLNREKVEADRDPEPLAGLKLQAPHFIIDSPASVLAGFPWFAQEWGRDALISLPGLFLSRGRFAEAFALLCRFAGYEKDGLLPNIIEQSGRHAYNSLDTVFLFARTVERYLRASGDREGVRKNLFPCLERIMAAFTEGRVPIARIGEDGLVYGGTEQTQLTWMDAKIRGRPVTPRHGAAVEINALYYNALVFLLGEFGQELGKKQAEALGRQRRLFEEHFEPSFWNEADGCLYDVYRSPDDRDRSIRPNQLFALGLPACALAPERARLALETVKLHLVTPFGLRTLSPHDPAFHAEYRGDQENRDRAYHQGPVWPWLIGIFFDDALKHAPDAEAVKKYFRNTFAALWESHAAQGCVQHLAEIFDAADPHRAAGCPAQAWSLAEAIRILEETK
jgi:predicted glycogen debranching enzyme